MSTVALIEVNSVDWIQAVNELSQESLHAPQDPVSAIILGATPRIARTAFLYFLGNAIVLLLVTNAVTIIFGSTSFPFTGFFEIYGFIVTIYAGVVWAWTRFKPSKGLSNQFYLLALLGIAEASVIGSAAAYKLVSSGYWMKQAWSQQACRCTYDNGEVVSVEGRTLACSKCCRKLRVGFDLPTVWTRMGNIALALGIVLYAMTALLPSLFGMEWLTYITWLLLTNGIVFSSLKFTSQVQSARFVHLQSNTIGSATTGQ